MDQEDVEVVLLQVMQDEFDVNVEDNSEEEIAREIMNVRKETQSGNFAGVEAMRKRFLERKGKVPNVNLQVIEHQRGDDDDDEADWSDNEDIEHGDGDVEMGDAQQPPPAKERPPPEIDEEGFTKVVGKKRR